MVNFTDSSTPNRVGATSETAGARLNRVNLPRLVIAAPASSAGKTTIATGLMGALRAAGHRVAGFKVGPDFIDPGYHGLATGRPGRNLDAVLTSEELIPRLLLHGAGIFAPPGGLTEQDAARQLDLRAAGILEQHPPTRSRREPSEPVREASPIETVRERSGRADVAIIEGVMGLFDGQLGRGGFGSTAHIARLVDAPVVLVVDAAGSSRTAAAAAIGLRNFDDRIRIEGVIVNRVGSARHGAELASVFDAAGMPVLGIVPRSASISAPSRHLGLVPAAERPESSSIVAALGAHIAEHVDLEAVLAVARSAGELDAAPWDPAAAVRQVAGAPLVGVLAGRAFTFRYPETEELLQAAGCRIVEIDPLTAEALPAGLSGLYIGGGFPEMHAVELSRNASLRAAIADAVASGLPTVAECAGQLYLGEHLDGHPMVGALPVTARMTPQLTLGYRTATAASDTLLATSGSSVTGHEFHRTQTTPPSGEQVVRRAIGRESLTTLGAAWTWLETSEGFSADPASVGEATLHSSYLHVHWAGHPNCAQRFADAAAKFAARAAGSRGYGEHGVRAADHGGGIDLNHHGDLDIHPGLVDLAVNVLPGPPDWLAAEIAGTITELAAYPDASKARAAIAEAHGVPTEMVLPTAGGAEAFVLVARTLCAPGSGVRHPLVVHPQFTEPEAALRAVDAAVQRWLLPVSGSDRLSTEGKELSGIPSLDGIPQWADAVFVGNPTNPTGWLHNRGALKALSPGRLLVVDEAFMDATDERESMIGPNMDGLLVLRSLSKTWGLAGLRVGYIVGDPALIALLERAQPPWPISAPAIAAMVATSSIAARAEAARRYVQIAEHRTHLVAALTAAGFTTLPSSAPFVLIETSPCGPASVRTALIDAGFAVRRGETFPGLGPTWIRVKVPEPAVTDRFVVALTALRR